MKLLNDKNAIIAHPADNDRTEVAALWKEVFCDANVFVDLFFERVYKPCNTLIIKRNNRIVSALQMIPYTIKVGNALVPSAYVCGVCTHPSERGQGLMTQLMNEATRLMRQRNYGLAVLIPAEAWLFDCYRKFGYVCPINRAIHRFDAVAESAIAATSEIKFTPYANAYFPYFDRKQRERYCALLHDSYDIQTITYDLINESGNAWVALNADKPVGIIFAKPQFNAVVVQEIFYDDEYVKNTLIRYIAEFYNARTIEIYAPATADAAQVKPYGLACIINQNIARFDNPHMSLMLD